MYASDCDSDYKSVTSENQPLGVPLKISHERPIGFVRVSCQGDAITIA